MTEAQNGPRKRVRNRLVAGVAVVGITVIGAGAPSVLHASSELNDAQRLVTLAEVNRQAVTLAHSLADERDEVMVFIAAGRAKADKDDEDGKAQKRKTPAARNVRVDRQLDELRATASPGLLRDLVAVPSLRHTALTGKATALETYRAYSEAIAKLYAVADELAEKTPADVADSGRAPVALDRAVEQASATRGLLLAALAVPADKDTEPEYDPVTGLMTDSSSAEKDNEKNGKARDALSAAAQQARVRELGALADFDDTAGTTAHDSFSGTVTGPDVKTAESYLNRLTDRPELSDSDRKVDQEKVESVLSARIDQMRGAESGLGTAQLERLEKLRDDDVTGLELRLAFLGGCLLIAVAVSTAVARTLTQPLAVLRIGAARIAAAPGTEAPIRYTGRNDEFAQAVRSVNALHGKLLELATRTEELHSDRTDLIGARQNVVAQRTELQDRTAEITAQLERLRHTVRHGFVDLSLRNLALVERQLGVIETMEEREQDPEGLATLFKLDHLATVMRRHSENLLALAGHEPGQGGHSFPVPLLDMLRAAVSEIERYERVTIQSLPPHAQVAGSAADDLSHLVAELLENAASFSPPDAQVQLSGWLLESGDLMLSVEDQGIGIPADRLTELNALLAEPGTGDPLVPDRTTGRNTPGKHGAPGKAKGKRQGAPGTAPVPSGSEGAEGLGLRVAGLLASRHGVQVTLREHQQGGVVAVVILPQALLPASPPAGAPHDVRTAGAAPAFALPGSVAEANSNALPGRAAVDPMVAAAEHAIRKAEAAEAAAAAATARADIPAQAGPARTKNTGTKNTGTKKDGTKKDGAKNAGAKDVAPAAAPAADGGPSKTGPAKGSSPQARPSKPAGQKDARQKDARPKTGPAAPGPADAVSAEDAVAASGTAGATPERSTPYTIGPDAHERAAGDGETPRTKGLDQDTFMIPRPPLPPEAGAPAGPSGAGAAGSRPAADAASAAAARDGGTGKGLPKRTPKPLTSSAPADERTGGVDPEDLRRRLGGFHQGAKTGRRDIEAELGAATHDSESTEETVAGDPAVAVKPTQLTGRRTEQIASDKPTQADRAQAGETVEEARS